MSKVKKKVRVIKIDVDKCNGCRACYSKEVDVIAYPQHGKKMAKVFKLKLV